MKLVLVKSGFKNKSVAALFAMNWNLLNNRPIIFKEESFVLFKLYSVYYIVCEEKDTTPVITVTPGKGGLSPIRR